MVWRFVVQITWLYNKSDFPSEIYASVWKVQTFEVVCYVGGYIWARPDCETWIDIFVQGFFSIATALQTGIWFKFFTCQLAYRWSTLHLTFWYVILVIIQMIQMHIIKKQYIFEAVQLQCMTGTRDFWARLPVIKCRGIVKINDEDFRVRKLE